MLGRYWYNSVVPKTPMVHTGSPLFPIKIDAINGRSIRQSPYLPASKRKSWTGGREWNRALAAPERTSYGKPAINLPWLGMVYIYIYIILYYIISYNIISYHIILYHIISYIYITNNCDDLVMVYWANPTWPPIWGRGTRHFDAISSTWRNPGDFDGIRWRFNQNGDEMTIFNWMFDGIGILNGFLMGLVYRYIYI